MARILDTIESPADVKKLSMEQLKTLAEEIRQEMITGLSKCGGHLAPNLGVVELTIAMHYVFNTPEDHLVFDVSHQCYIHKLLTGRRQRFHTIRQENGLSGFMNRAESPHDSFGAGHAGTAVSAGLGLAVGRDIRRGKEHVVVLAGDAAFTNGVTFEGLNNISQHTKRLIIVLNDNEWSIDKNVGAVANLFNRIVTHPNYFHLHEKASQFLERVGGKQAIRVAKRAEEAVKGLLLPSLLFEDLGLTYYGPVDGHDFPTLINCLEFLKKANYPVILHAMTKKGKGFEPALQKTKKFHGLGPYDPETGETKPSPRPTYSEVLGDTLIKLADVNQKIVAITGAMPSGTGLDRFQPRHPDRYFDVGIAEGHAVLFSAGLAAKGLKPFCAIYSTFMQRAYDMVVHDICLQNLPVVICMDRAGLAADDGPTHHGLFDISFLRSTPNLTLMAPKNGDEFVDMLYTTAQYQAPIAMRYPRGMVMEEKIKEDFQLLPIGKAELLQEGKQIAIWSYGTILPLAQETAEKLQEQGYSVSLVNARFAKPLDIDTLQLTAKDAGLVITFEDHAIQGGFGSIVLEELQNLKINTPVVRIGWPDVFIEHGKQDSLRKKHGLTVENALKQASPHLKKMKPESPVGHPVAA
ncbi:MAG: 1-deoxy-D-xylulose-5-phosphate synthase [Verrucomicrobiota bacterium]